MSLLFAVPNAVILMTNPDKEEDGQIVDNKKLNDMITEAMKKKKS